LTTRVNFESLAKVRPRASFWSESLSTLIGHSTAFTESIKSAQPTVSAINNEILSTPASIALARGEHQRIVAPKTAAILAEYIRAATTLSMKISGETLLGSVRGTSLLGDRLISTHTIGTIISDQLASMGFVIKAPGELIKSTRAITEAALGDRLTAIVGSAQADGDVPWGKDGAVIITWWQP
jgi:hypothetical protein